MKVSIKDLCDVGLITKTGIPGSAAEKKLTARGLFDDEYITLAKIVAAKPKRTQSSHNNQPSPRPVQLSDEALNTALEQALEIIVKARKAGASSSTPASDVVVDLTDWAEMNPLAASYIANRTHYYFQGSPTTSTATIGGDGDGVSLDSVIGSGLIYADGRSDHIELPNGVSVPVDGQTIIEVHWDKSTGRYVYHSVPVFDGEYTIFAPDIQSYAEIRYNCEYCECFMKRTNDCQTSEDFWTMYGAMMDELGNEFGVDLRDYNNPPTLTPEQLATVMQSTNSLQNNYVYTAYGALIGVFGDSRIVCSNLPNGEPDWSTYQTPDYDQTIESSIYIPAGSSLEAWIEYWNLPAGGYYDVDEETGEATFGHMYPLNSADWGNGVDCPSGTTEGFWIQLAPYVAVTDEELWYNYSPGGTIPSEIQTAYNTKLSAATFGGTGLAPMGSYTVTYTPFGHKRLDINYMPRALQSVYYSSCAGLFDYYTDQGEPEQNY